MSTTQKERDDLKASRDHKRFEEIKALLITRLNKLGSIRTQDAWKVCSQHFEYEIVRLTFVVLMEDLIARDKAIKMKLAGTYFIYRNF